MEKERQQRRRRSLERTRQDILRAFVRVLARKGLIGTTVEDVAREAGYSTGSLYYYFRSKEEMSKAMLQWLVDQFLELLAIPVPEGTPFPVRLRFVMSRLFETMEANYKACVVTSRFLVEMAGRAQRTTLYQELQTRIQQGIEDLLRPGVEEGYIPQKRLKAYAIYFRALMDGIFLNWTLAGGEGKVSDRFGDLVDFFLKGAMK